VEQQMDRLMDRYRGHPTGAALNGRGIPLDARAALLQASLAPARVTREAAQALAQLAHEHILDSGRVVFQQGEPALALWLVVSGQVALGTLREGRLAQQTRQVEPGQWLDAASAWLDGSPLEDAVTQSPALLWAFDVEAVRECCVDHPSLAEGLIRLLAGRVRLLTEGTLGLMLKDAEARCATWLLEHAEVKPGSDGSKTALVALRERKRAIASQLAVTPETFSRVLRQLRERQVIDVAGYTVKVLDVEALRRAAGTPVGARVAA
jgi:CRP-like cAMP-binding protein